MTTEVAYARVPAELKAEIEARAETHGVSQTAAIVELIERGLRAEASERRIQRLEAELATALAEGQQSSTALAAALERERTLRLTYDGLLSRLERPIAKCPTCTKDVSGYDLLAAGQCKACKAPLTSLLLSAPAQAGLNQQELLLLLGALGLVLTLAYVQSKGP